MKHRYFILSAAIAAVLASAPSVLLAASADTQLAAVSTNEAPRVTQTVDNYNVVTIPKTHLAIVDLASSSSPLDGSVAMSHMQLVLKPSAARQTAMEALIAKQHNPKSAQFDHWLTPQQFGDSFGVVDGDVAAVTAWLVSQGFTVNSVYPNKAQIDFSGTVAQVNHAFHTQETIYTIDNVKHLANAGDISVPVALQSVIAGVMGLHDSHPTALVKKPELAQWSASKKGFVPKIDAAAAAAPKGIAQAVSFQGGVRGLVPNDMATMYGIKTIRNNGVTGSGITIAVVEDGDMVPADWDNFIWAFNLAKYGGTFRQFNPAPTSGPTNCLDPSAVWDPFGVTTYDDYPETLLDAEWSTAIAPGANIEVATCSDYSAALAPMTTNFFGGVFIAATNLINGTTRPDIISASYGFGENSGLVDSASKTAIDLMWAQADAEGISVFVSTGDSGTNPSFNGSVILGAGLDANALATSPHDTGVGGTDLADVLDGTTSQYFAPTPSAVGGSALSYVPEIPWNESCGNGVAAKAAGYSSAVAFCQANFKWDPEAFYISSEGGSGGPSTADAKPSWQTQVYNAANDKSRDLPDVALFAGSYGGYTWAITCTSAFPCVSGFSTPMELDGGTSLSTPMFAGIQALIDQGLQARGLPVDQGNAAPTLYALAAQEYGGPSGLTPSSLAACNADNGAKGTASCVFHNVTRGSNSTQCIQLTNTPLTNPPSAILTPNCYFYGQFNNFEGAGGPGSIGLTAIDASPTSYGVSDKAYAAQPGWSFTSGLGSVNATNLLIAWRTFDNVATPAVASP
ncbi:S53 family peptidase [Dyella psychrodurans]|uniref:Peptidase S53 domain-containing protein n=1 Tax=Dyella psychrodurans TaxID=1927960 RepID=A0A370WY60_9GAMM|nr:protease pro-enzyme activation domain-containing protein [Dyella psychrodurans]RDS80996.1 hypothetical protein DWU99_18255 [Dyella psychrodurans]